MKIYFFALFLYFNLVSCQQSEKLASQEQVLERAITELYDWETIIYNATTSYLEDSKPPLTTVYKLKRVPYEPHLKLFFYKEMNQQIAIYYKLAALAVVEHQKKKITHFDYGKDRSIPKYLEAYMSEDDNLWQLITLMNSSKSEIQYIKKEEINKDLTYAYKFKNHTLWLRISDSKPVRLQVEKGFKIKDIVFENVIYNTPLTEDVFTPEVNPEYVSTTFGIKKEPMLNIQAPEWQLKDVNGNTVSSKEFKGKPLFLEAWISSCSHCMESLPKIKMIQNEFGDKINVVTVNFDCDSEETQTTIQEKKINYKVLLGDAQFDQNYDLRSFPSYFVIDSNGKIIFSERGTVEGKKEKALLEALNKVK